MLERDMMLCKSPTVQGALCPSHVPVAAEQKYDRGGLKPPSPPVPPPLPCTHQISSYNPLCLLLGYSLFVPDHNQVHVKEKKEKSHPVCACTSFVVFSEATGLSPLRAFCCPVALAPGFWIFLAFFFPCTKNRAQNG